MVLYTANRYTRATAALMGLLSLVFVALLPRLTGVAVYLGVLLGLGALLALYASVSLLLGGLGGRVVAVVLAGMSLCGHVVSLLVGLPAAGQLVGGISPLGFVSLVINATVLAVLTVESRRRSPTPEPGRPYAL